jgi:hypothetical protein
VFGLRHRPALVGRLRSYFVVNPLVNIAIMAALGLAVPVIDNAAHAGGLVTGVLLSLGLADRVGFRPPRRLGTRLILGLDVVLVAAASGCLGWGLSQAVTGIHPATLDWLVGQVR